jgi:hypothetical protein
MREGRLTAILPAKSTAETVMAAALGRGDEGAASR